MIILENNSTLTAYKNCDFNHVYDLKESLVGKTFKATLEKKNGELINFTINTDSTKIILSLTKTQINDIGIDVVNFDVKQIQNGSDTPIIKGSLTVKNFITD